MEVNNMKCAVKYANNKNGYISKWENNNNRKSITTSYIIDDIACFNSEQEALAELPTGFEYIFVNWKTVERKQKAKREGCRYACQQRQQLYRSGGGCRSEQRVKHRPYFPFL